MAARMFSFSFPGSYFEEIEKKKKCLTTVSTHPFFTTVSTHPFLTTALRAQGSQYDFKSQACDFKMLIQKKLLEVYWPTLTRHHWPWSFIINQGCDNRGLHQQQPRPTLSGFNSHGEWGRWSMPLDGPNISLIPHLNYVHTLLQFQLLDPHSKLYVIVTVTNFKVSFCTEIWLQIK